MKLKHLFVVILTLVLFTSCSGGAADNTYTPVPLETDKTYYADIDIADYGLITVELDQEAAPVTCANFVELSKSGFYDGLHHYRNLSY